MDPWSSETGDYSKVFSEFGVKKYSSGDIGHRFFRRKIVVGERDFHLILEKIKAGKKFVNVTGVTPSGRNHLGHYGIMEMFKFFKDKGGKNYFAVADIEAFSTKQKFSKIEELKEMTLNNLANYFAMGLEKKDVYLQSDYQSRYYSFGYEIGRRITENMFKSVYGSMDSGKFSSALLQFADILHPQLSEFEGKMPSITCISLDQDPHARLSRDMAVRLPYDFYTPSFLYIKHLGGLRQGKKMSSSEPETGIFLDDSDLEIEKKIAKAVTGGKQSLEEQKREGGEPEICKVFELLTWFEEKDKEVERIRNDCKKGKWLCGECKKHCSDVIKKLVGGHRKRIPSARKKAEKFLS